MGERPGVLAGHGDAGLREFGQHGETLGRPERKLKATLKPNAAELRSVAFSGDGKLLAAGTRYGKVQVWDASGMKRSPRSRATPATSGRSRSTRRQDARQRRRRLEPPRQHPAVGHRDVEGAKEPANDRRGAVAGVCAEIAAARGGKLGQDGEGLGYGGADRATDAEDCSIVHRRAEPRKRPDDGSIIGPLTRLRSPFAIPSVIAPLAQPPGCASPSARP